MKKKTIIYIVLFLIVPLILSLSIAIATDNQGFNNEHTEYDGINVQNYEETSTNKEIKKSNTYTYLSLFTLIAFSGVILVYIKQKREI